MTCNAVDPCNPHAAFMPLVETFASLHASVGGGLIGIAILQFGLWFVLYAVLVNVISTPRLSITARWIAGIVSYLCTGLITLALTFYAITPAVNLIGVAYLTLIWPLWTYLGVGIPGFIAPFLFSFGETA